jgi:outer membrane protein OmpA-like peptidoglycan-associated protein
VQPSQPGVQQVRPTVQPRVQPQQPAQPRVQPPQPGVRQVRPAQPGIQPVPRGAQPVVRDRAPPAVSVRPSAARIDTLRDQRRELRQGNQVVIREPGRTIVREGNRAIIRRDDVARLRLRSAGVRVERRGNEILTFVERPDGVRITNVVDRNGRLIRRIRRDRNGREVVIINNRVRTGIVLGALGVLAIAAPAVLIPRERYIVEAEAAPPTLLYETLTAPPVEPLERAYALDEILYTANLRDRMPRIDIDTITFDFGSWEVTPDQAAKLGPLAEAMLRAIELNPNEVYLIEGHTDAVGSEEDNLSLSDRRAEAVAIVLTEQYGIPAENLTTQGYGEEYLKVSTQEPERRNRRVTVRRLTPLLTGGATAQPQGEGTPQPGGG